MSRRFSIQIILPIEGYEEDKIYKNEEISLTSVNLNKKPDDVYYRYLKEKSVYASSKDIVKFVSQKYSLGEMHDYSMHNDWLGDYEIIYEGNKYIDTAEEAKLLEKEYILNQYIVMYLKILD